jgi:hypothetical protein
VIVVQYFLDLAHSCIASTRVETDRALRRVQSRLNAVLPEKNDFIQHPVLQMKLHVLRGELTVLVENMLSESTVEAKLDTLTSYEMDTSLDAFVEFFLDWAQNHLQATLEHADWPLFGKPRVSVGSATRKKSFTPSKQAQAPAAAVDSVAVSTSATTVKKSPTPVKKGPTPVKEQPAPAPAPAPTRAKRARASKDATAPAPASSSAAAPATRQPTRASQRARRTVRQTLEMSESEYEEGNDTEAQAATDDDSEADTLPARRSTRAKRKAAALPAVEESDEEEEEEVVQRAKSGRVQKQRQQPTRPQPKRKPQEQQQQKQQKKPAPKKQPQRKQQREESSESSEDDEQYDTADEHDSSEDATESERRATSSEPASDKEDKYALLYEIIENSGAVSWAARQGVGWTAEDVLQLCEACLKVLDEDQWQGRKSVLPSAFQAVTDELKARGINRTMRSVKIKCMEHVFSILQEWAAEQGRGPSAGGEAAVPASSPRPKKSPARSPAAPGSSPSKKRRLSSERRSPANGFATQDFATQELDTQEFVTQEATAPVTPPKQATAEKPEVITTPAASTSFFAALTDSVKKWFTPSKSKEADQPRRSDNQTDSSPENYAFEHRIA